MTDQADGSDPGRRPTMVDVARAAGVSLKTVSRVANEVPTVRADLAERVQGAMAELGFKRNHVAANLRSGRTTATIGLIIRDLANPFYSTIAAAATAVAERFDTRLITASSGWDPARERELVLDLFERRVDGLIVVPSGDDQSYFRTEIDRGTPAVFIDSPPDGCRADTALLDNRTGTRDLVRRLIAEGHRGIGTVTDTLNAYTMGERRAGAREALGEAGIDGGRHAARLHSDRPRSAGDAVGAMLDAPDPPTALFCGNNRILLGVVEEMVRRRTRLRLAAFDDFEFAPLLPRPVTVVGYDTRELGRLAAEMLFRRLESPGAETSNHVVPTYLVDRGTEPAPGRRSPPLP